MYNTKTIEQKGENKMQIKEMAEKLGMTPKLVRRFIRAGKIKAEKDDKGRYHYKGALPSKEHLLAKPVKAAKPTTKVEKPAAKEEVKK